MDREFSCFFTGHRIIAANKLPLIEEMLRKKIRFLIEDKGVTDFIAGGALGFDTMAEKAVLELKEEYDYITLRLYLPCYDRMKKWSDAQRFEGRMIMSKSEYIYVTEGGYTEGCMQKRNKKMADDAKYCIAYCDRKRSGASATVGYAEKTGCIIDNIAEDMNIF